MGLENEMIIGKIAVDRMVAGKLESLVLIEQHHYKEWVGCYIQIFYD